jgi:glycosyltransferase involved in cell wall biosynthesis
MRYHGLQVLVGEFYEALRSDAPPPVTMEQAHPIVDWTERIARQADREKKAYLSRFPTRGSAKVLVTGATDFIGTHLLRRLLKEKGRVRILARHAPAEEFLRDNRVEVFLGNLGYSEEVDRAVEGISELYHLGAAVDGCGKRAWSPMYRLTKLLARVRPRIVHFHLMDACNGYPWLAKLCLTKRVFITDHVSRPAGYSPVSAAWWKRPFFRLAYLPVTQVICVSSFVSRCVRAEFGVPARRVSVVYNGVDIRRVDANSGHREEFRRRHGIPQDRVVVLQVSWLNPRRELTICSSQRSKL